MPPKAAAAADSSAHTALTVGETTMLAAVCAQLGDVPKVDFEIVAQICGIKFSRNARASCKKLFEKIKAAHPEVNMVAGGSGGTVSEAAAGDGSEENEGAEASKRTRPAAKKAPKKAVGKTPAPKKAASTSKKALGKKSAAAKAKEAAASKAC
ncbi:hypothetical protein BKA64DRAFT_741081 [Cadophora sp. MPI-SDFR-AT-0126]|nr:hypothetical protein BKA64DRAFT_741081 [Leotiomycetes sp. MPI-SDFR-AT-0126]